MLEMLNGLKSGTKNLLGPGPTSLVAGTSTYGYYGETSATLLFTGTELITALGITEGVPTFIAGLTYFKFAHAGKIKYIPKMTLANSMSWQSMYIAGAVYPGPGPGAFPPTGLSVAQGTIVSKGGFQFTCHLMDTGPDPMTFNTAAATGSEFCDLLYRMMSTYDGSSGTPAWGAFSATDLNGQNFTILRNSTNLTTSDNQNKLSTQTLNKLIQGFSGTPDDNRDILNWRPVLQLIPPT